MSDSRTTTTWVYCTTGREARRRRRTGLRRFVGMVGAVTLGLSGALVLTGPAMAADGPFDINGSVPDAGTFELGDVFGSAKEIGPKNASSTKIGVIQDAPLPMLGLTNPNAQVDLRRGWLDLKRESGKDWVYFAWERDSNSGSGFIAYEFMRNEVPVACDYDASDAALIAGCNPWKNRTTGDFLILWDQQGGSTDLYKRVWSDSSGSLTLGPVVPLDASVSQAQYSPDGFRGEAAVNLTDAGLTSGSSCVAFANVIPSTVTGNSDSADYKDTILEALPPISTCTASVVTTPKQGDGTAIPGGGLSIGTGVVAVKDEAVVSLSGGTATPAGSVSFFLCKLDSGTCTTGGTAVGSTALSGASYPATVLSPVAYVTAAGRYCWRGVYGGDAGNNIGGASESAATECFTVNPVTPTLSTTAGADQVLGQAVSDSATLGGTARQPADPVINLSGTPGPVAGGTITFKLYGPSGTGCGSLVHTSDPVTVSGNGTYDTLADDPQAVPTAAGDYHWVAEYSGSSPNTSGLTHNATCTDTAEDVSVTSVASSLSSAQSWVPNDSVTVSAPAGGALAGTVSFDLYGTNDCTGTPIYSTTQSVSGASPQTRSTSNTTPRTTTGSFSWKVGYDSTNPAQRDIPDSCHETSALTIANGGTISSP